jgi:hypothetical protein
MELTCKAKNTRTQCCVEYLVVYFHVVAFKKFILECACKAIKPVNHTDKHLNLWETDRHPSIIPQSII